MLFCVVRKSFGDSFNDMHAPIFSIHRIVYLFLFRVAEMRDFKLIE